MQPASSPNSISHATAGATIPSSALLPLTPIEQLLAACRCGDGRAVRELLVLNPEIINAPGSALSTDTHETPLIAACRHKHLAVIVLLLALGADTNTADSSVDAPLHAAVRSQSLDIVVCLLEHGANIEARARFGRTPLHIAVMYGNVDIATALLVRGADVDAVCSWDRWTPLLTAVTHRSSNFKATTRYIDFLKLLIAYGADVNATDTYGVSILCHAAGQGDASVVFELVLHGADVHFATEDGHTPLHAAAYRGREDVMRVLLAEGVDVDGVGGKTPLHVAANGGYDRAAAMLLAAGADINARDERFGYTPLESARTMLDNRLVIAMLMQHE